MKDYLDYSKSKHVNVIPEADFKELVAETFTSMAEVLRSTYGPYGSSMILATTTNETTTTKDGYNVFSALGYNDNYQKMVYMAIKNIIERVNKNVGDGTTSCILIADKLFRNIETLMTTPDDKRRMLEIFDSIEKRLVGEPLKKPEDLKSDHFRNIIMLAANYDAELTDVIINAFAPEFNEDKTLRIMRNIITETETTDSGRIEYKVEQLPGKYRVRVDMNPAYAHALAIPSKKKVVIFDHTFTQNDWSLLTDEHDKETDVVVLATGFSRGFMDNEYLKYLKQRELVHQPVRFLIGQIKGLFVQDEVQDLAAVLKQKPWSLNTHMNVNYNTIPEYDVQVYAGNCLCFDNVEPPVDYIETLRYDMKRDLSKSLAKKNHFIERINALTMEAQDTLLTVKATTSLEAKLIADKIDDCVAIIKSAATHGVVPNMLRYAYYRLSTIWIDENCNAIFLDTLAENVVEKMKDSVKGLFEDIWRSKYGNENELSLENHISSFYNEDTWESFDIIEEKFCNPKEYCTSAQYDIEVLLASLSIVKYLITSKGLIFDASLMKTDLSFMPN